MSDLVWNRVTDRLTTFFLQRLSILSSDPIDLARAVVQVIKEEEGLVAVSPEESICHHCGIRWPRRQGDARISMCGDCLLEQRRCSLVKPKDEISIETLQKMLRKHDWGPDEGAEGRRMKITRLKTGISFLSERLAVKMSKEVSPKRYLLTYFDDKGGEERMRYIEQEKLTEKEYPAKILRLREADLILSTTTLHKDQEEAFRNWALTNSRGKK